MSNNSKITFNQAILLMFGNMVGVGIFLYPTLIANKLNHPILFVLSWIFGGIIALAGALSSAELAFIKPELGGDYAYLRNAYGNKLGFLYGFLALTVTFPGSIALGLTLTYHYQGSTLFGSFMNKVFFQIFSFELYYYQLYAILTVAILAISNIRGLKLTFFIQKFSTLVPIFSLIAVFIFLNLVEIFFSTNEVFINNLNLKFSDLNLFKTGTALVAIYWTFSGWNAPLVLGDEIENAKGIIPRVMITGPIIVTALYCFFSISFLILLPFEFLQNENLDIFQKILNLFSVKFHFLESNFLLSLIIFLIVIGNINSAIITGSRIILAMSNDKLFFKSISKIHPIYNSPRNAILLLCFFSIIIILFISKESNILNFAFIALIILSILTIFSVFIQKKKYNSKDLIKYISYPISPIIYIGSSILILFLIIKEYLDKKEYLIPIASILILVFGYIIAIIWETNKKNELSE